MDQFFPERLTGIKGRLLWTAVLLTSVAAFALPIAWVIAAAPPEPSPAERAKIAQVEAQAQARVALFELRKIHENLRTNFESMSPLPIDFPADGAAAQEELRAMCRDSIRRWPEREAVFQQAADGQFTPELQQQMIEIQGQFQRDATRANSLNERVLVATRQCVEAHERTQREAAEQKARENRLLAEKQKREYGWGLGMTMEGFRYLKDGTSKFEVDMVLDCYGEPSVKSGNLEIYQWREGFKFINCTFRSGELISKAQAGL
ncbi:hypothetical protein ETAA8_14650 [Anatilimnocola aggregata]|uniref:Uncharacterized protein n=1 Tax=Anatilimnocola aggregata TaxID=2528021 RepID=A0A517Y815_9BACT|nr:hypothetical protein [Anatilimnocola aggregata]QDU26387.1 hypothetical protein ETAA8_14650 [Anatilimnocola aggregata]